jgi:hypothetical protein
MKLSKLDRDSLIELSKEKKVFLEGNIIKLIVADEDDNDFKQYLNDCKVRDNGSRRKRLEITKQVQIQNNELVALNKENERINKELKESLHTTEEARRNAEILKLDAEKLRDGALEDLDSLQKRTQFELMSKIVKVALYVIIGVGLLTTALFSYTLVSGKDSAIVETTWSNLFGILLTNSFSIIGTIMGVKYATKGE